jgi:hypothetical protein
LSSDLVSNTAKLKFSWSPAAKKGEYTEDLFLDFGAGRQ